MTKLTMMPEVEDALNALYESDLAMAERVEEKFDALTGDPYSERFRRRKLTGPARFLYVVFGNGTGPDWVFLWYLDETTDPTEVVIDWLGENRFG
ncbi:hypothetical protein LQL77_32115 [Rhodococcus cerastii]|nr:hypothetical protein [Rhodococcus cerastii]